MQQLQSHQIGRTEGQTPGRPLRLVAAVRDLGGDSRRQKLLHYLETKARVTVVPVQLSGYCKWWNLARSFFPHRLAWINRSKRNAFYWRQMSHALSQAILQKTGGNYDVILLFEALYSPGLGSAAHTPYVVYEDSTSAIGTRLWPDWVPHTARSSRYQTLESAFYRGAARLLTSNEAARSSLLVDYGLPPDKVITVGQGCDFFQDSAVTVARQPGLILFVGYEFERKGGPCLLQAFRLVRQSLPSARLLIVGPRLSLNETNVQVIERLGDKQQLRSLYALASAFALPAIYDPMPHAALEAMSFGLPVVVSNQCGTQEIIRDGESGLVVPSGQPALLAEKLLALLGNPSWAAQVGQAGAEVVRRQMTWEQVAASFFEVLNQAVEQEPRRPASHSVPSPAS